jgi:hypothetical protein
LGNYFRIANEDDDRCPREKVTVRVVALDRSLEDTLPYLFSLLGIVERDDPLARRDGQVKKRRTLEAAVSNTFSSIGSRLQLDFGRMQQPVHERAAQAIESLFAASLPDYR